MSDLLDAIQATLIAPHVPLWFPDLTGALVERGERTLLLHTGITMAHYGTARVCTGDARAPRHVVRRLSFRADADEVAPYLLAECLVDEVARHYQEIGLTFYTPEELAYTPVLHCLQAAIALLASVPTLHHTVAQLVRVCHLLKSEHDDYDVSYSDPHVPFSIFMSTPQRRVANEALRVAESLVHEAMHLQLTLIEHVVPLVHLSAEKYFSPWKGAYRSAQGVVHALYVFRVIDQGLERLLALPGWPLSSTDHMRHRRHEIASQVREIEPFQDSPALTATGARFVQRLMSE